MDEENKTTLSENQQTAPINHFDIALGKKMKPCKSCGNAISKNAKVCPSCGAKNKKPIYKRIWFWIVAAIIICSILSSIANSLSRPETVINADKLISDIGNVTIDSEDAIIGAEKAVEALSEEERLQLRKLEKLEKAREEFNSLLTEKEIKEIEDAISSIGGVTIESEEKIKEVRELYDESSDEVKAGVKNIATLEKAEKDFSALNVDRVIECINKIGNVSLKSEEKITEALDAYNSLTEDDKTKVTNIKTLNAAEKKYNELKAADKKKRLNAALSKLNSKYDRVEGITWYQPKAYPQYTDTRNFVLPYIGKRDSGTSWLRLRMNYTGDDWIFWTEITFLIDGERSYKSFRYSDIERDNDYGDVWEYGDSPVYDSDIELLKKIANSKETIVRFEGTYRKDITISASDKTAIKQVLAAYEIMQEK